MAALENPPATPISARAVASSQMFGENAISAAVKPPKMLERITIALRPTRSATSPQSGANSAPVSALIEKMIPDHSSDGRRIVDAELLDLKRDERQRKEKGPDAEDLDPDHDP